MIRPFEWDEHTTQIAGLTDLFLSVYLPTGECVYSRKAFEESRGLYRAHLLLPAVWYKALQPTGLAEALDLDEKVLSVGVNGRILHVAFSWEEDESIPLDDETLQGGVKQQIEAAIPSTVVVSDSQGGTFGLIWTSPHKMTILGGTAVETLGLTAGDQNFREVLGARVILRWHSASAEINDPLLTVVIAGERATAAALNTALGG